MSRPVYSVVLPVYNEEACLEDILRRVCLAMDSLDADYEVICADDGSTDGTWPLLNLIHKNNSSIKAIRFLRNFGHQIAIFAGIKHARGDYVAVMDADGQDPPEFLPALFNKCRNDGYDVVYAIRRKRKENFFKRLAYKVFYRYYQAVVPFEQPLDSGDFSVFSRDVAQFIQSLNEKAPFIRGLRSWRGGKQCGLEYERQKRSTGQAKYSFYKLMHLAVNATVSFSKMPLRAISIMGICVSFLSLFYAVFNIVRKLTIGVDLPGWTSIAVLVTFLGGLNLFVLGIIGEYMGQIFDEVKNRPVYLIESTIGLKRSLPVDALEKEIQS